MRPGTARQGKSCIAWEEAVFLQSPRQRLMRDASKTAERWVIPLQTLRAIVSTSFRSEPSIRPLRWAAFLQKKAHHRAAELAASASSDSLREGVPYNPDAVAPDANGRVRKLHRRCRSHETRLSVCSKPRRNGSLLVEAIRCPSVPSSCDCSVNLCICSWACRDHSSNASVGPFTRANSATKFKAAIMLAWPKSINLALKSRKPSPAEEKLCSASLAACSAVAVPFSNASRAVLAPASNDFLAGLFSAMSISRWNLARRAKRLQSGSAPSGNPCERTRPPEDRSAATANSCASAGRAELTRRLFEFRRPTAF